MRRPAASYSGGRVVNGALGSAGFATSISRLLVQQLSILLDRYFDLAQDFSNQGPGQFPTLVMRNCRTSAIRVSIECMASFLPSFGEAQPKQELLQCLSIDQSKLAQTATSICWIPTNSGNSFLASGSISSIHNSMTSFRFL